MMLPVGDKELLKDLELDQVIIKKGKFVSALKVNDEWYKLFHHTGWWRVPVEYFEPPVIHRGGKD